MQHNITRGDLMLLGETIRLLTLGSQPRGAAPKALRNDDSCWLPTPSVRTTPTVLSTWCVRRCWALNRCPAGCLLAYVECSTCYS